LARRDEIVDYANELLEFERFPVDGRPGLDSRRRGRGAEADRRRLCRPRALFERAAAAGAQMVLVHHRACSGETSRVSSTGALRGPARAAVPRRHLLVAYHLALDAHGPEIGQQRHPRRPARARPTNGPFRIDGGRGETSNGTVEELMQRLARRDRRREPIVFGTARTDPSASRSSPAAAARG
jgi:hypothetical protein